jgi:hypothetical protein
VLPLTSSVSETQYIWTDSQVLHKVQALIEQLQLIKQVYIVCKQDLPKGVFLQSSNKSRIVVLVAPLAPTIFAVTPTSV